MKKVEAIIRPQKLSDLLDELNKHQFYGITVTHVMGCGKQGGRTQYYRGNKLDINLLPKIKLELVVRDSWVEEVVSVIEKIAKTGEIGDGKIFIFDVSDAYRIRTGESGENAIL